MNGGCYCVNIAIKNEAAHRAIHQLPSSLTHSLLFPSTCTVLHSFLKTVAHESTAVVDLY